MANTKNQDDVKGSFTSDGLSRANLMTREQFLDVVLHSGQLSRIGQHLALVVFLVAEGRNQLRTSVRDLEKITGWSRPTIKEHLDELEIFWRIKFGGGRAKALFELQGVIENALTAAVVAGSRDAKLPKPVVAKETATSVVANQVATSGLMAKQPATTFMAKEVATKDFVASQPAANPFVASHVAASLLASVAATTPVVAKEVAITPPVVASQIAITSPSIERERESNNIGNISFSLSHSTPREEAADDIQLNGVAILGPNFKVSYAAIDQAAALIGMPKDRARAIAEICARDWAMNGVKPQSPMAVIKRAMKNDFNEGQIQDVRMEKARADAKPKESRAARLLRHVEEAAEKGWRRS